MKPFSATNNVIRFIASVSQVKTLTDGGLRLVLDLPETAIETATKMMQAKQAGAVLEIAAVAVEPSKGEASPVDFLNLVIQ